MHINKNGIRLRECPLCGKDVEIKSGAIVCKRCRLSFNLVGCNNLQDYVDRYWNKRFYDNIARKCEEKMGFEE